MSGRGKGGNGLGKGGAKRHRKVLRDNIQGITKSSIRRLARRGGVKRIGLVYEETRGVLKVFLENVLRDAVTYTEHALRKTVTAVDVVRALRRHGHPLFGFGGDDLGRPDLSAAEKARTVAARKKEAAAASTQIIQFHVRASLGISGTRNLFIKHSPAHFETFATPTTLKMLLVQKKEAPKSTQDGIELSDDPEDLADEPAPPPFKIPTTEELRKIVYQDDKVQMLRHALKAFWYAKLKELNMPAELKDATPAQKKKYLAIMNDDDFRTRILNPSSLPANYSTGMVPRKFWASDRVYALLAEMLGVNIYVRSIPQGVPQGVWTLGSDQGTTITNPQFKVDARVDVQAGQGETRLQLGDWTEAVYTEPDGRCFYHAVVGCLGEKKRVELPPLAAPKFAAEIIRHVKLPALVLR